MQGNYGTSGSEGGYHISPAAFGAYSGHAGYPGAMAASGQDMYAANAMYSQGFAAASQVLDHCLPPNLIALCVKLTNQSQPFSLLETSAAVNNIFMCVNSMLPLCCVHVFLWLCTSQVTSPDTFSPH